MRVFTRMEHPHARRYTQWIVTRLKASALLFFASALALHAQTRNEQNTPSHPQRKPDIENVRYGPHEMNDFDLYLAKSDKPTPLVLFYFPGAFVVGNKYTVPPLLIDTCRKAGVTVAAVNYRYSTQAPYPALFLDAARGLQFLRLHAQEYNLNPKAVASTGSSAGADISLWLGFHDDLADPASDDPVKRQSTRVAVVGALAAQTTLDPRVIAKIAGEKGARNSAFPKLYGLRRDEMNTERAYKMYEDASAAALLTKNAPPVFFYYSVPNKPVTGDTPDGERIHHPLFGFYLKERMDKMGVECLLRLREDYPGANPGVQMNQDMIEFFLKHFPR
jgi:acetyl esterase